MDLKKKEKAIDILVTQDAWLTLPLPRDGKP